VDVLLDGVSPGVTRCSCASAEDLAIDFTAAIAADATRRPVVHFVMQRKQLLGIVRRAETIDLHLSGYKAREGEAA
jgi:hypothetical protein